MEIVNAYELVGSYRGAAELCGTTHKTVKRIIERRDVGQGSRRVTATNTAGVRALIAERVRSSDGRISAKRLLPIAQAAGYAGSARNFRRAVADAKTEWKRQRRTYRPWLPTPGEHLAIDWAASLAGRSSARCWPGAAIASCGSPPTSDVRRRYRSWQSASLNWMACQPWC